MSDNENKGLNNPEQFPSVPPVEAPIAPVSFDSTPPISPVTETPVTETPVSETPEVVQAPEIVEIAKPIEAATPEEAPATPENANVLIKGLEQSEQALKDNFRKIESSFIDIGKTILESGVFVDEEYTAVNELLANAFNRYEEIATIINAQIEQMKKLGEAHIKDELPLKKLMEKVSALESKLAAHQAKNRSLLDSLVKIKEVFPEKVVDIKLKYERKVKQSLKAMSDFSLSHLNTLDIDSVPEEEKEHLNIIFNVYDSAGFADVSKSFVRAEDYYLAEAENLKNPEQNLLDLYQKDKALEANKPKDQHLVDENLRSLFLLKDLFDLNPEMYKKVILNFQLLDEYKDDLKELQPYLQMQTGYYDLNFLKKRVLDLAKEDPGMVLEYLENKLEDLKNAKKQLDASRVPAPDKPWNNSIQTIKERFAQAQLLDDLLSDLSQVTTIYEPGGEAGWTGAKAIEAIKNAKALYQANKDIDQAVAGVTTMLGLRDKVKFLLKAGEPVGVVDTVIVGKGAEEVSGVAELEKAAREISQMAQSGEFRSDAEAAARDYADMVVREKFPTKPKVEVGEDADIVDEVIELKPEDIEYVDEAATLPAKPKYDMPPLPVMETVPAVKTWESDPKNQEYFDMEISKLGYLWDDTLRLVSGLRERGVSQVGDINLLSDIFTSNYDLRGGLKQYLDNNFTKEQITEYFDKVENQIKYYFNTLNNEIKARKSEPLNVLKELKDLSKVDQVSDEVIELQDEDIEYVDEAATSPAKLKYDMPPLPAMETVKQEEEKSAESNSNIELQRQFVENFWKNNKELSDKLQYYQIMYRELKNMADARAGAPVLDDMATNLLTNLNSYIKENYGKKSEAEIIEDVAKQLESNDEKLQDLYKMFTESKTVSGELNVAPVEQTPMPEMAKVAVGEGAKSMPSPEGRELSLSKMIAEAQSFDDLAETIQKNKIVIQGSQKLFKTEDLLASINAAKIGIAPNLWLATRTHGFREKLKSLYDAQRAKTSGDEVIELSDEDVEDITEKKPVKSTPPPLPPRMQRPEEREPISLTEDMKKKPTEPEPISLTEDMKKKTVAETPDWRTEAIVDAADRAPELTSLADKLGKKYRDQKANLIDISNIYHELSQGLSQPENLAVAQAWFAETLGMNVNKESILNHFLNEVVDLGDIKNKYQASRKLFSGNVASFNFRNAVDLALANVNDFVDQLNLWQETVYNTNRRPAPQIAKTKFPTILN